MAEQYQKPYLDSSVFIGTIRHEVIERKETVFRPDVNKKGQPIQRQETIIHRVESGKIGAHILTLAQEGTFLVYTSSLTLAEVHKQRHQDQLSNEQDENILAFFEHDWIKLIDIDRRIGEQANEFCRTYGVYPNDAIHLACALRAGCDVLLTWDLDFVNAVQHSYISVEQPQALGQLRLELSP